jgi:hypothetical protein
VRTGSDDALSLLRKWRDESTLLSCEVNSKRLAVALDGRVVELDDNRIRVRSDDERAEMLLDLALIACFGSADANRLPGGESFDFGLIAFFSDPAEDPHPESVQFVERRG